MVGVAAGAARIFGRIDYELWESLGHNPIQFLREIGRVRLNQAADDEEYLALYDRVFFAFDAYMSQADLWAARVHPELANRPIAYFRWNMACTKPCRSIPAVWVCWQAIN